MNIVLNVEMCGWLARASPYLVEFDSQCGAESLHPLLLGKNVEEGCRAFGSVDFVAAFPVGTKL